jgi:hypothetical protein
MEKQPSQHTPASIARNIGIGVITPVLAATIIYFLGFNRSENGEFNKKKAATIEAWNAYEQNKAIFSKVFKQMDSTADLELTRKKINYQIDAAIMNMENIKKETNADQRVFSCVDLSIQQIKDLKPVLNKYLDDMLSFIDTNPTEIQGRAFVDSTAPIVTEEAKQIKQRDSIRMATYYEGLHKDYGVTYQ